MDEYRDNVGRRVAVVWWKPEIVTIVEQLFGQTLVVVLVERFYID